MFSDRQFRHHNKVITVFRCRLGFTLAELLIVVIILSVIAAVTIPKLVGIQASSEVAAVEQDLAIMRDAIERYKHQHNGRFPGEVGDGKNAAATELTVVNQLTMYTNVAGEASPTAAGFRYGPYLKSIPAAPAGPLKGNNQVDVNSGLVKLIGLVKPAQAWKYNCKTGELIFNYSGTLKTATISGDKL